MKVVSKDTQFHFLENILYGSTWVSFPSSARHSQV